MWDTVYPLLVHVSFWGLLVVSIRAIRATLSKRVSRGLEWDILCLKVAQKGGTLLKVRQMVAFWGMLLCPTMRHHYILWCVKMAHPSVSW